MIPIPKDDEAFEEFPTGTSDQMRHCMAVIGVVLTVVPSDQTVAR
jgi:hypothetical protein